MAVIKVMDEILANKIAAGEVVEKCASVVKELVENSIDADSTEIKVELKASGTKEIKVIDNGKGMDYEDAKTAFLRHATSKIITEDDLYRIHTLGFRGEALASIASVSKVEMNTSTGDVGTRVLINGGIIELVERCDARKGTVIAVKDLFYNTPARLKHLKSLYTELANITDYMNKLALAYPGIRFVLTNDDKEILNTAGSSNQLKVIGNVFGISVAKKMLEVSASNDDYEIKGYISLPEIHRSTRSSMITIVNGRVVRNNDINRVINDAYHSYKPDNYYPIVVLNIDVDTTLVDVNIHPTKMDIKFGKIEGLLDMISEMIKKALNPKTLIPHIEEVKPQTLKNTKVEYETLSLNFDEVQEDQEKYVVNEDYLEEVEVHQDDSKILPIIYPVGLVFGTYIVGQNENGMYLIDQHAAKERINYEYFKEELSNPKRNLTDMLVPMTLELSNSDYIILKQNMDILTNMGFNIEEFGINSIIIKSHPVWLLKSDVNKAIEHIVDLVIHQEKNFSLSKFNDHLAATVACKASIKANTNITLDEMTNLINDLRKCQNPFNCPHGRPTTVYYSKYDLEKMFKRSGF